MVHHSALEAISLQCTALDTIKLSGTDVDDLGVMALATNLKAIRTLHLRGARYVSDDAVAMLVQHHATTLRDLDVTRCCLITKSGCLSIIQKCTESEVLSMACGIKRGGWLWTMDNDIAHCILTLPKGLKKLEYLKADNGVLGEEQETALCQMKGVEIQRITTWLRAEMSAVGSVMIQQSGRGEHRFPDKPVLMEQFIGGQLVYSQRFRR